MMDRGDTWTSADNCERAVLGAVLNDPAVLVQVRARLRPDDFRLPAHRSIWTGLLSLTDREAGVDELLLDKELAGDPTFAEVGGLRYLMDLADVGGLMRAKVQDFAGVIADESLRRRTKGRLVEAVRHLEEGGAPSAAIAGLVADLEGEAGRHAPGAGVRAGDALEAALAGRADDGPGVALPLRSLTELVGTLQPGSLVIVAGRTACGKTSLLLQVAATAALAGAGVRLHSLEMTTREIILRLLSQLAGFPVAVGDGGLVLPRGADGVRRFDEAKEGVKRMPLVIDDDSNVGLAEIRARAERQRQTGGLTLLVIDYLQLLRCDHDEGRTRALEELSRGLKLGAKALGCVIVAAAQLNRQADAEGGPKLAHIRGSGSIEQDADVVLLVDRPDPRSADPRQRQAASVIVAKNRHGPVGEVPATFEDHCTRFVDMER